MRFLSLENLPRLALLGLVLVGALVALCGCPRMADVKSSTARAREEITVAQQSNQQAKSKAIDAKLHMEAGRKILAGLINGTVATTQDFITGINAAIPEFVAAESDDNEIIASTTATDEHLQKTAKPLDTADRAAKRLQDQVKSEKEFHGLIVAAIIGFAGIAILAYCMHSIRIGIAGAIGCGVVILSAILVGEIWSNIGKIVIGLCACGVVAVIYEMWDHGALSPALFKSAHDKAVAALDAAKAKVLQAQKAI